MLCDGVPLLLLSQAILAFSQHCPAGMRKTYSPEGTKGNCEPCPDGQYQSNPNDSSFCWYTCTVCSSDQGSMVEQNCTKTANAKCRCRDGFTPQWINSAKCKCQKGSGLKETDSGLQCQLCSEGYFTSEDDMYCQKWKDCGRSGIRVPGSRVSDVICNNDTEIGVEKLVTPVMTAPSVFTGHPNQSQVLPTTIHAFSSVPVSRWPTSENSDCFALVFYVLSLVLLVPLSAVSCKLLIIPCLKNHWKKLDRADIPCRSPVEECGDTNRSSLVKSCQGLP
ncbi:tumor necrosis factor receptor superfamily member 4-like isoform X1 [Arapaima gigas]